MSSPGTGKRAPVYQIDFTAVAAGKRIASTKRRVRWRFGFANPDALASGETGTSCRGEEHDITIVWSLTSGKRMILADGQEVHYSNSRNNVFEYSWTMKGNHVLKLVAHAAPPLSPTPGFRQYDFFVNGQSFFSFPKVFRLGMAPNDPRARSPGTAQMAEVSHRYTPGTVGRRPGSVNGIASIEAPGNVDEEELYLQEAIRQSLQDDEKEEGKAAPAPASNDLLDFASPAPPVGPGAIVPSTSSDPFGFSASGPAPGQPGPYGGALVPAPASSGYGGYAAAPNPYGGGAPSDNPYGAPATNPYGAAPDASNPYGAPTDATNPYGQAAPQENPYGPPPTQDASNPYGAPAPTNPYGAPAPANPYRGSFTETPTAASNPYGTAPAPTNTFPGAPALTNAYPGAPAPANNNYPGAPSPSNTFPGAPAPTNAAGSNPYNGAPASANPYGATNGAPQGASNGFGAGAQTPGASNFFGAPAPTPGVPTSTPGPTSTNPYGAANGGGNVPPSITPRGQQTPSTLGFGSPPAEMSGFTPAPDRPSLVSDVPNTASENPNGGSKVDQAYAKLANLDTFSLVSKNDDEKANPFETLSVGGTKSLADLQKSKPKAPKDIMKSQAVVVSANQNGYASQYGIQQQQPQYGGGGMQNQQQFGAPMQQFGAPPAAQQQQFGAPPAAQQQQQFGAPPAAQQQQFGAQPQQNSYQQAPMQQQQYGQQPPYGQQQFGGQQQPSGQQPQYGNGNQFGQQPAPQQSYGQSFGAQQPQQGGYY